MEMVLGHKAINLPRNVLDLTEDDMKRLAKHLGVSSLCLMYKNDTIEGLTRWSNQLDWMYMLRKLLASNRREISIILITEAIVGGQDDSETEDNRGTTAAYN